MRARARACTHTHTQTMKEHRDMTHSFSITYNKEFQKQNYEMIMRRSRKGQRGSRPACAGGGRRWLQEQFSSSLATRYAGCPKKKLESDKKKETVNYNNGNDNTNNNNGIGDMLMERHHTKS